eukprot:gene23493-27449_t
MQPNFVDSGATAEERARRGKMHAAFQKGRDGGAPTGQFPAELDDAPGIRGTAAAPQRARREKGVTGAKWHGRCARKKYCACYGVCPRHTTQRSCFCSTVEHRHRGGLQQWAP